MLPRRNRSTRKVWSNRDGTAVVYKSGDDSHLAALDRTWIGEDYVRNDNMRFVENPEMMDPDEFWKMIEDRLLFLNLAYGTNYVLPKIDNHFGILDKTREIIRGDDD